MGSLLANHTDSRDNNFNLLRFLAAGMVLVGHSFPLSGVADEPLFGGLSLGYVAVDVFFVTSGLLVTRSLLVRGNPLAFAWARFVRIYPALWVAVLFCALPLGLSFSSLGFGAYLGDGQVGRFVLHNGTLVFGKLQYTLPGVFTHNPYPEAVNGSLWTLPWEIRMYAVLGAMGALAALLPRAWRLRAVQSGVVALAVLGTVAAVGHQWSGWWQHSPQSRGLRLLAMFFVGGSFYVLRGRVVLSHGFFLLGVVSLVLLQGQSRPFFLAYMLLVGYLVLYLGYVPGGFLRSFNRLGDVSYGLYIYAFPVQQGLAALQPGLGPGSMVIQAGLVTLVLAIASWRWIEKPALRSKEAYRRWVPAAWTRNPF
ncbi:MAG: acyltransferase [Planctomycetes bacterium]|nr:acyltransferase [Planctomycetota bacterium]MCB9909638.1 acyltransferase [Planctomycetota bacterium]MCB9911873.1 acyltransferase [Planctomycetota bacterium]HPF12692.1 acyltransferase [Planctomycetota bacterium]HRV80363.1 acyltransferase [Planctomycetota bacterium]